MSSVSPIERPTRAATVRTFEVNINKVFQTSCLELYFSRFNLSLAIIHRPSFVADKYDEHVVRTMVAIGGSFSTDANYKILARKVYSEQRAACRRRLISTGADSLNAFGVITEALLLSSFELSHLDLQDQATDSRDILYEAVRLALQLGVTKPLQSSARAPETLHARWLEWVKYETWKRLCFFLFITDCYQGLLFNGTFSMNMTTVKQNLPVNEAIWDATNAHAWQDACLAASANTEKPAISTYHSILNFYHIVPVLNEASSTLFSTFLLIHICELSDWSCIHTASHLSFAQLQEQQHHMPFGAGPGDIYGPEYVARERQLQLALNILVDRTRSQRLASSSYTQLWEINNALQQFAFLRLHLSDAQTTHGIVNSDFRAYLKDLIVVAGEELGNLDYSPITMVLSNFLDMIASHLRVDPTLSPPVHSPAFAITHTVAGCVIINKVLVDIWRVQRYTALHINAIRDNPELLLAQQSFFDSINRIHILLYGNQSRLAFSDHGMAMTLAELCMALFKATDKGTYRLTSEFFARLGERCRRRGHSSSSSTSAELDEGDIVSPWQMLSSVIM